MNAPQTFDEVLDRVADGGPIDWDAAERLAHSPEQSAMLRNLRILAELHATHLDESVTTPAPDAAANDLLETSLPEGVEAEPTRWGQYQLVRRIGEGHFGVVYLARDEHLAREVAIKLLHGRVIDRQSVIAEGRALALVDHPNVLTVYGIEEHQGQLALCMKYIRGRTLEDIVRTDGPMNADEALVVARAVCSAVAAVHAAGVLHRDIKARNVMRERQGRYVLMDFGAGVPQAPDGSSSDETTIGTPLYMAPELLERRPASRRSDVYAIGVLLYFLVTGEYPVAGRTTADIVAAHRAGRRTRLDERRTDLPPSYVRAVDRATSPVLAERPESAAALLRALTPDEPPAPAPPLWRRVSAPAVALVGVALVTLAAFSGLLTTWTFNAVLNRPKAFDPTSTGEMLITGFRSLLMPAVLSGVLLSIAAVAGLVAKVVRWTPRIWLRMRARVLATVPPPEYAAASAQLTVLLGITAVTAVMWLFGDVVLAFVSTVSQHDLDRFSFFRPESFARRVLYRTSVITLLVLVILGWRRVRDIRSTTGGMVPWWLRAAVVALVAVLLLLSQAPYQAMYYNQMPVVLLDGNRCYLLGEQPGEMRVFCPASGVPRVRTVTSGERNIERCDAEENVFVASTNPTCPSRIEP